MTLFQNLDFNLNNCNVTETPQKLNKDLEGKRLVLFKPVEISVLVLLITYGSAEFLLSKQWYSMK